MQPQSVDILMITYNRPRYTSLSLPRLLETCDERCRVWVWHNGNDTETLEIVRSYANHPRFHHLHHSPENLKLREPTNWFWSRADGDLLGKVDDDCLMPDGWIQALRQAHADVPEFGVIGCWLFREEDFVPELALRKIAECTGGHRLMKNCWIGGSGYLMKRACFRVNSYLRLREEFTSYCIRLAHRNWINGWVFPFLYMDHMDDPRSTHCRFKTDADFRAARSLSAISHGHKSLKEFMEAHIIEARRLQAADPDPRAYVGWHAWRRRQLLRVRRLIGGRNW